MRRRPKKSGRGGIRKVTIPNLSGLTRTQAQSLLSSLGLTYSESTTNTSDSGLTNYIQSQAVSSGSTVLIGSSLPFIYYNYVPAVVTTYGPCEAYGSGTQIGSGTQCSGDYYQTWIDYSYSSRKKIYLDGVWDGSSYSTDGCSSITSRTITSSAQVDGQCGHTTPINYTYGPCEAYGSPIQTVSTSSGCGTGAYTTYHEERATYRYNTRKKIYANGVWDGSSYSTSGCGTVDELVVTSRNQIDGLCGYTAPCTPSSYSEWTYSNITWSGNCVSSSESGTASSRSRTDNCNNTYNESGSYAVTRPCTPPTTITYGTCQAYGEAISGPVSSRTACDGTYTVGYQTWTYAARRTILENGSWNGYSYDYNCGNINQEIQVSYQQLSGSCGCCAPVNEWHCTESYPGGGVGNCSYTKPGYNNSGSGTGYSRSCVFGTSYPACGSTDPAPPPCSSYKYNCKSYDVTNPASNNYFQCYYVGQCAANNNSDGSRTTCCAD